MTTPLSRREILQQAGFIGLGLTAAAVPGWSLPAAWLEQADEVVPFTDATEAFTAMYRRSSKMLDLNTIKPKTPVEEFFGVQHYGVPEVDPAAWRLRTRGLVAMPLELTLDDLKRRARVERTVTFECSGNQARIMQAFLGTTTWAGASLADLLGETGPGAAAKEVIFWCADSGTETIRDNEYEQHFARSMSLADAMASDALLAFEMDGQPLPAAHGAPVRLVVPGWYGICNVKWLTQIELSADRLMARFMGRDYVTIQGREVNGGIEWIETSVTKQRIKSIVARVTRRGSTFTVFGAAYGSGNGVRRVEVQVDGGGWRKASLEPNENPYAWTFWTATVDGLSAGEHRITSRATDGDGTTQPENLDLKRTRWENNEQWTRTIRVG